MVKSSRILKRLTYFQAAMSSCTLFWGVARLSTQSKHCVLLEVWVELFLSQLKLTTGHINVKKDIVEPYIFLLFCPLPITPMINRSVRFLICVPPNAKLIPTPLVKIILYDTQKVLSYLIYQCQRRTRSSLYLKGHRHDKVIKK